MLREVLEGIDLGDDVLEHFMKNVVDPGTSLALSCHVFHEATLKFVTVLVQELGDEVQDYGSHAIFVDCQVLLIVRKQLPLLLLNGQFDLLCKVRDAALDVAHQNPVQRLSQVRNSHL